MKKNNINNTEVNNQFEYQKIKEFLNKLNEDQNHMKSRDDICTPMECVEKMINYIPNELWSRKDLKILDPCSGNGNFGAYCATKTQLNNIYFNEISELRVDNCKELLNPPHLRCGDAFDLNDEFNIKYDLILANPPYSGGGNKNRSLSNKFIEYSIDLLKDNGYLCFITPNNWMSFNNHNTTLKKLLKNGSFIVIDNDVKRYFNKVGSSFCVFVWQKGIFDHKTTIYNSFLKKDIQENVVIYPSLPFIPLYISQETLDLVQLLINNDPTGFKYRCDLHNFTKSILLSDNQDQEFKYPTIHTIKQIRYAKIKQDIFDKYLIIVPLSTYFLPFITTNFNVTQSVGFYQFDDKKEAEYFLKILKQDIYKVLVHISRFGNFNNIKVLKHLKYNINTFDHKITSKVAQLVKLIKY
ncbi:Eco57I restriction-modification methylase domain-containing protein [Mycoplasma sp. 5912]